MQRAFFYTGLAGGGVALFLSLALVGSLFLAGVTNNGSTDGIGAPAASGGLPRLTERRVLALGLGVSARRRGLRAAAGRV